jgi:hypothetical protein
MLRGKVLILVLALMALVALSAVPCVQAKPGGNGNQGAAHANKHDEAATDNPASQPQKHEPQTGAAAVGGRPAATGTGSADGGVSQGIGQIVSAWTHQGIHGRELSARIHALKGKKGHGLGQGHGQGQAQGHGQGPGQASGTAKSGLGHGQGIGQAPAAKIKANKKPDTDENDPSNPGKKGPGAGDSADNLGNGLHGHGGGRK